MQLKCIVFLLVAASFFLTGAAMSCAPSFQLPEVRCIFPGVSDRTIQLQFDQNALPTKVVSTRGIYQTACGASLLPHKAQLNALIEKYVNASNYVENKVILRPYDADVVRTLEFGNTNLLTCRQYHYEKVGTWMVYYQYVPSYCVQALTLDICGQAWRLDFFPFITYLVTHPSSVTLSYLALIAVGIGKVLQLLWQQRLWVLLKPKRFAVIGFMFLCPTLFFVSQAFGSLDIGVLGWVLMVWIIVKLITLRGVIPR